MAEWIMVAMTTAIAIFTGLMWLSTFGDKQPKIRILQVEKPVAHTRSRLVIIVMENSTSYRLILTDVRIVKPRNLIIERCSRAKNTSGDGSGFGTNKVQIAFEIPEHAKVPVYVAIGRNDGRDLPPTVKLKILCRIDRPYFQRVRKTLEAHIP